MAEKHERARGMAEHGIDAIEAGDRTLGKALIKKAKALDPSAASEVGKEIEQERRQTENFARKSHANDDKGG